jgi:MoaA/NifB/PqqE/SkfB family radical SAM enzyme
MDDALADPGSTADQRPEMELLLDVVGTCNLRCPSCAVGNTGLINPTGLMDRALFNRLLAKAVREYRLYRVSLYNWAEPLLHPELPEFVRTVKSYGLFCALSSNLNLLRNPDELLRANPDEFRISISGFTQAVYGQTHSKGNVERVKENMRLLSEAKRRTGNTATQIHVLYHKYKHNLHEIEPLREYAARLGFDWMEMWAFYMPMEKAADAAEGKLPAEDRQFVERFFALPLLEALHAARPFKEEPCRLWREQLILDLKGNVILCCAVYNYGENTLGPFMEMTPADLARAKANHPSCVRCTGHAIHQYYEYHVHPELSERYEQLVARTLEQTSEGEDMSKRTLALPLA